MKKLVLFATVYMVAQTSLFAQEPVYVNNSDFMGAIAEMANKADTALWNSSRVSVQNSFLLVKDETQVQLPAEKIKKTRKAFTDEAIYAKRKSSVVLIVKLRKGIGATINFDVKGTGFFISKEGHLVTNNHVVQELVQTGPFSDDLLYFVITEDKKSYVIDKLLSYSKNNDLAILGIKGGGRQFDPIPVGKPAAVGAAIYCISHPAGALYYFSKGMVARNTGLDSTALGDGYSRAGKAPIRMEVSADYAGGSSGGPIIDQFGNLVGVISATSTIYMNVTQSDGVKSHPQMVIRPAIPVKALTDLLK